MSNKHLVLKETYAFGICLLFLFLCSCKKNNDYEAQDPLLVLQKEYKSHLETSILYLDSLTLTDDKSKRLELYLEARNYFKRAETVLAFVEKDNYKTLNQPNILKVEEEDATNVRENIPFGFQVIEEQLHDDTVLQEAFQKNIKLTRSRLGLIANNTVLKLKDYHILWLIRDEIVRVSVTGVTGFDSPVLERSLEEAILVYSEIKNLLSIYKSKFKSPELYELWIQEIDSAVTDLDSEFNDFDRYNFIKNHTHKQLELFVKTGQDWNVVFPFELALNNEATSLFSSNTFNIEFFSDYKSNTDFLTEKVTLGKQLFNDKRLSKDNTMNCASCHHEDKAFTDGLKTFPEQIRNTPTLTYAALQQSFFFEGRAGSLEGQIVGVVENPNEFHTDLKTMTTAVLNDSTYVKTFNEVYNGKVNSNTIRHAIATYIRTLNAFNSKFDDNINGVEESLTLSEKNGFNLFMGKAKCATCHFAPVFNGTVPPNYTDSELELLGVPKDTLSPATADTDLGRYNLFKTESRKHFFKTPTVRNVSKTAPYMHNGVYSSLEQLMTFYNNGGGSGIGLDFVYQTLPSDSLNLSDTEVKDIIEFMKSLEDR